MTNKKRKSSVTTLLARISDSRFTYRCTIHKFSTNTFQSGDLPLSYDETSSCAMLILNGPVVTKLAVRPCWCHCSSDGKHKTVGFTILDPPALWNSVIGLS